MRNPAAQLEAALKARARNGARRAAVMGIAVLLLLTGAGFLISALWIATAATWSPLVASLLLSMVCLVAGAMIFLQVMPPPLATLFWRSTPHPMQQALENKPSTRV